MYSCILDLFRQNKVNAATINRLLDPTAQKKTMQQSLQNRDEQVFTFT